MAKIYSQASRVIVWLGDAADDSDQALEEIRAAGSIVSQNVPHEVAIGKKVFALLQRPWFRRIWVREKTDVIFGNVI